MRPLAETPLPIPEKCPTCHNPEVQFHSKTLWCLRCGWAKNRYRDPGTGRYIERKERL